MVPPPLSNSKIVTQTLPALHRCDPGPYTWRSCRSMRGVSLHFHSSFFLFSLIALLLREGLVPATAPVLGLRKKVVRTSSHGNILFWYWFWDLFACVPGGLFATIASARRCSVVLELACSLATVCGLLEPPATCSHVQAYGCSRGDLFYSFSFAHQSYPNPPHCI